MFVQEVKDHLIHKIIPFWEGLKDEEFGGYYGYKGFDLEIGRASCRERVCQYV